MDNKEIAPKPMPELTLSAMAWVEDQKPDQSITYIEKDLQDLDDQMVATQEMRLTKKHEEIHWVINVFGNGDLSSQDKLSQLPQFKDWLLAWKNLPDFIGQGITNFSPQKLVSVIYEVVSESVQETGNIPSEFTDFIDELAVLSPKEKGSQNTKNRSFPIASRFAKSFADNFSGEVVLIAEVEDTTVAKSRTIALVKIVDYYLDKNIKNIYQNRPARVITETWWYKTVVREKYFSNPILLDKFLYLAEQGKRLLPFNAQSDEVSADAVNCTLGILDLVKDDPARNTKATSTIRKNITDLSKVNIYEERPVVSADIVTVANEYTKIFNAMRQGGENRVVFKEIDPLIVDSLPIALLRILTLTRSSSDDYRQNQQEQDSTYFNFVSYLTFIARSRLEEEFTKRMESRKPEIGLMLGRFAHSRTFRDVRNPAKPG